MDERDGPDDQRGIKNREKQHVAPSCDGGAATCQREVYGRIHIAGCGLLYSRCIELIFFFRIQKGNRQIVIHSFISYLTDYRMDIAEELILSGETKSYKVAEKVGYLDANYFSYVFKKRFGVSPSKYRARNLQKESES